MADLSDMTNRGVMIMDSLLTHYAIRDTTAWILQCNCGYTYENEKGSLDEHARHQAKEIDMVLNGYIPLPLEGS